MGKMNRLLVLLLLWAVLPGQGLCQVAYATGGTDSTGEQEVYTDTVRDVDTTELVNISGSCGDNASWNLNGTALSISGSGAMTDYSESNMPPWYDYAGQIESISIADGITAIGSFAFYECTALRSISLPDSITTIGDIAFAECSSLEQVSISSSLVRIGNSAFEGCTALAAIRLPDSLTSLGTKAFYRCHSLTGIVIPEACTQLGEQGFAFCTSLVYAKIQAQITSLPVWFFYGCSSLTTIYLPDSISSLGDRCLAECSSLTTVDYNGDSEVKAQLQELVDGTTETYTGVISSTGYSQTDSAQIYTYTASYEYNDENGDPIASELLITATVENAAGWEEVAETLSAYQYYEELQVTVYVSDGSIEAGELSAYQGLDGTVTICTTDGAVWELVLSDQGEGVLAQAQDLSLSVVQNDTVSSAWQAIIGDTDSFTVTLGDSSLKATVSIPVGNANARRTATLYQVVGGSLVEVASVLVDDAGLASFALDGTTAGDYVIALDVAGVDSDDVLIPAALAAEYGIDSTLTDAEGNYYTLSGSSSSLPFTLTQLMVGLVVGMVLLVAIVGGVTYGLSRSGSRSVKGKAKEDAMLAEIRAELAEIQNGKGEQDV